MGNRSVWVVVIVLLAAHAPLGFNDGLFMDDWLVLKVRSDYAVNLDFLLHGAGHPIFFGYIGLANLTGVPILFMKIAALAGILCGSVCLALAATRLNLLDRSEAVGFALIVWAYPGYQLWAGKTNALYVLSFGLFFVGAWLLTLAFSSGGARHVLLRIGATLVFVLSFALNSTIVLFAFAMLGLFVAVWRNNDQERGWVRHSLLSAWRCAIGYPELMVLPLVYWGVLNVWFKRVGVYAGHYNAHVPTLSELVDGWKAFFFTGYRDVLTGAARAALHDQAPFILAAVLVGIAFLLLRRPDTKRSSLSKHSVALPLSLGLVLFLALSLPYLIAGLQPAGHFYESRHLLMFGLPLALGLLAIKRVVETVVGANVAFAVVFGATSTLSIAMLWNSYILMQTRVLRQEALIGHLAAIPKPPATVFAINNRFLDYPSARMPFGLSEVTGMLRLAWGNLPLFGFTLAAERPTILREMEFLRTAEGSAFHHIDPSGPQATISFQPGPAPVETGLVRHYYACRLLPRCDVSTFLMSLASVTIEVGPITGITPLGQAK